jgi:hypothetical protein
MSLDFAQIRSGESYSRQTLAQLWGYSSFHALARGVVTPRDDNKIVLFVTENKQDSAEQYSDKLHNGQLEWEGPTDHFAEERMLRASTSEDEIHLFHRDKHHSDFDYVGQIEVMHSTLNIGRPSKFTFRVKTLR